MFDKNTIQEKLRGLVGFKPSLDPSFFSLDSDNQDSRSGYFFNDVPYAKLEALKDTQDFAGIDETQFNALLKDLNNNAITSVCNAVFTNANTPSFVDRQKLYKYAINKAHLETTLKNGFVGHRFQFENRPNVTAELTTLTLDFQGTGDIEILLYNTQQLAPIQSQIVTIDSDHKEVKLNWKMTSQNGDYYLGYIFDGSLTPYKRDYETSNIESCFTYLYQEKRMIEGFTGGNMWDLQLSSTNSGTTGLNPDITIYNDWTDLIVQNEQLFANAIYLQGAISFLNYVKSSIRSNKTQRLSEQQLIAIQQTIEGQEGSSVVRVTGLRPSLGEQIKLISQRVEELRKGYFVGRIKTTTLM